MKKYIKVKSREINRKQEKLEAFHNETYSVLVIKFGQIEDLYIKTQEIEKMWKQLQIAVGKEYSSLRFKRLHPRIS